MFQVHECFKTPQEDVVIWRFIDFSRFVSLLDKRALWFSVPSKLSDPWEGLYPKRHMDQEYMRELIKLSSVSDKAITSFSKASVDWAKKSRYYRDVHGLNCWYENSYESDALWKLYSSLKSGIAIRSTVKRFKAAFSVYDDPVYIGRIRYLDHEEEMINMGNTFWTVLWKRRSFEHEKEIRAVVIANHINTIRDGGKKNLSPDVVMGKYVAVDVEELIEKIYVSPLASPWFVDVVRAVVKRYNLTKEVYKSILLDLPSDL
ncbi:hypothetical protein HY477_00135 [Candidatus Uhrbacteria bacterium]|nr:hypothetical protein [Candidatus Uhrbacteria bacterium]